MTQIVSDGHYLKRVIQLALPMAVTQLITMGSGFLCMTMLARLGHTILAASALIFSLNMSIFIIGASPLFSLGILIGHAYGERKYLNIGGLLQQGWLLALALSIPTLVVFWNIAPILIFFHQDISLAKILHEFYHVYIWRVFPFFFSICNQQLCYGTHKQKIDMYANMLGIIILVGSSYILIFGKLGIPAQGVIGFAYGSVLQGWFYFLFTTICLYFIPDFKKFDLFHLRIRQHWDSLKQLFKIGWPICLQISGEMLSFVVTTTFIGWLGINALAAYQVVMQYQFLVLVPVFALSQASGILLGQAFGSKKFIDINPLGQACIRIALVISMMAGLMYLLFPKVLASLYLNTHDPAHAKTLHLIILLFTIAAFSQLFDAIKNVLTGSLRGLLDTKFPMFVGLFCIWLIGIPLAYLFAFVLHWGVAGVVSGWLCGVFVSAIILYWRWRTISSAYAVKEMST